MRQINEDGKKAKDVIAHRGEAIEVTNEEAVKFAGYWHMDDEKEKKKVKESAKLKPDARRVV